MSDGNDPAAPLGVSSPLAPLRHPVFRQVWIASLASNLGGLIQAVGAAWLMTSIAQSADMVALVQASTTLPVMIFSLAAGAIADNFDRRGVMLVAQGFMLAVSVLLALFAWQGGMTPWLLLTFTFLIGCGTALNNPSWQASVGDMAPRQVLPAAVALNSVNFNLTRSVGPAIGGAIVAAWGAPVAFAINALSYLPLIGVLARWKPDLPPSTLPRETLGDAMTAGLRYVAMSPHIEKVILRALIFGFGAISVLALLPLVTRDLLGGGALLFGIMLGCYGIGAVGGAFIGAKVRERFSNEAIVRAGFAIFALAALVIGWSTSPILTGVALLAAGCAWVMMLSLFNVTVQLSTPRWVLGRALALYQTAAFGGMTLGSWIWGVMTETYGLPTAMTATAGLLLFGAAIGWFVALPERRALDLDPLNRWKAPALALDIRPRSGPIVIMIEYVIREADLPEFLAAMHERRRIRRRDGARQWELMRDTEKPDQWIETFHVPTWTDYVRHNHRTTRADAGVGDRIRALHAGDEPPRVHRMIVRPTEWQEPSPEFKSQTHLP